MGQGVSVRNSYGSHCGDYAPVGDAPTDWLSRAAAGFSCLALLAYSNQFVAAYSLPKLAVLSVGMVVMSLLTARGYGTRKGGVTLYAVPFVLVCALSAINGDRWLAFVGRNNSYALGVLGLITAMFYHKSTSKDRAAQSIIAGTGAVLGLYAFHQWGNGMPRAIGTIGSPPQLGIILAMMLPLAFEESRAHTLAVFLGLIACGSRGAWVASAAALVAVAVSYGWNKRQAQLLGVVMLVGSIAYFVIPHGYERSDIERVGTWQAAAKTAWEHPWLGVGADGFGSAFKKHKPVDFQDVAVSEDAHNDILQVLATTGIIGLAAYLLLLWAVFRTTLYSGFGALVALFVGAKFNPIPLEAIVLGAVICGVYSAGDKEPLRLPTRVLAVIVSVAVLFGVGRLCLADYHSQAGNMAKAVRLNPYELTYKVRHQNAAVGEINATKDNVLRAAILQAMRVQAAQAITLRPGEALAWNLAGTEAKIEQQLGVKRNPAMYLNRAKALDPLGVFR